jgi:hypothetical protein
VHKESEASKESDKFKSNSDPDDVFKSKSDDVSDPSLDPDTGTLAEGEHLNVMHLLRGSIPLLMHILRGSFTKSEAMHRESLFHGGAFISGSSVSNSCAYL